MNEEEVRNICKSLQPLKCPISVLIGACVNGGALHELS